MGNTILESSSAEDAITSIQMNLAEFKFSGNIVVADAEKVFLVAVGTESRKCKVRELEGPFFVIANDYEDHRESVDSANRRNHAQEMLEGIQVNNLENVIEHLKELTSTPPIFVERRTRSCDVVYPAESILWCRHKRPIDVGQNRLAWEWLDWRRESPL